METKATLLALSPGQKNTLPLSALFHGIGFALYETAFYNGIVWLFKEKIKCPGQALTFMQALRANVVGTSCDPDGKVLIHLGGHFEGITVKAPLAHGAAPCADCGTVMDYAHQEKCRRLHGTAQKICGACKAARHQRYEKAAAAAVPADAAEAPAAEAVILDLT